MMKDTHGAKPEEATAAAAETGLGHDTITATVAQWLTHHVQQEVLHVLHDALKEAASSLEDPLWDIDEAWRLRGWVQKPEMEPQTAVESPPAAAPEPQLAVVQREPQQPEPEPKAEVDEEAVPEPLGIGDDELGHFHFYLQPNDRCGCPPPAAAPEPQLLVAQQGPQQSEPEPEAEAEEEAPEPPGVAETQPPTTNLSGLESHGMPQEPPRGTTAEVYEGIVKLRVNATGAKRQVIQFVEGLRQKSIFRVQKLVGDSDAGVDIWLGLRAPVSVEEVLLGMEGVSEVEPADQLDQDLGAPLIRVRLAQVPSAV